MRARKSEASTRPNRPPRPQKRSPTTTPHQLRLQRLPIRRPTTRPISARPRRASEPPALDGHQEQLASLLDQRKSIREQYRNGDISAEDKDRLEDEVNDRISDLRAEQKQAAFVENYNQQMAEQEYLKTVASVKSDIRRNDGIDYDKNPMLLQNWDLKVRALASDPANAGHDGEWYLREAHKQVLSEVEATAQALGFQRTPRGQGPRDPVRDAIRDRRPPETRAKSLAALPAAAADSGHDATEFAHLDSMSGDDLENAVARMSPEQQERWARL